MTNQSTVNTTNSEALGFSVSGEGQLTTELKNEKLVLVRHNITLWSGQCKLEECDYNKAEGKSLVKEEGIKATSGQKWLIDSELLRPFSASKKRFLAILEENGVRFMGGYGVPASKWSEIKARLDAELATFERIRTVFLGGYMNAVRSWAAAHPQTEASILMSAPKLEDVTERIQSGYLGVRLNPIDSSDAQALDKEISGLSGQLAKETMQAATLFVKWSMKDDSKKLRSLKQLEMIASKLRGLSFIAPGCLPFSTLIERELRSMRTAKGTVDNVNPDTFRKLLALTAILTNEEVVTDILEGRLSMAEVSNRLKSIVASAPAPAACVTQSAAQPAPQLFAEEKAPAQEPVQPPAENAAPEPETVRAEPPVQTPAQTDDDDIAAYFNRHAAVEPSEVSAEPQLFKAESTANEAEPEAETPKETYKPIYRQAERPAVAVSSWF